MVALYLNEEEVKAALKRAKTAQEVWKIVSDLEQRMAPEIWLSLALEKYRSMPL